MPLRREAANLSRMRSPASSRSNWAASAAQQLFARAIVAWIFA
jgi:hypothetical protein